MEPVRVQKIRMMTVPDGEKKFDDMYNLFENRMDGRTERQTNRYGNQDHDVSTLYSVDDAR